MINHLFLICGNVIMLFNLVSIIQKFHTWTGFKEFHMKYPRFKIINMLYGFLVAIFLVGYTALNLLWARDAHFKSNQVSIIAQLLFWGAVFVSISNFNLFLLFKSSEQERRHKVSSLEMSMDAYINSIPGGVHHCVMNPTLAVSYVSDGFTNITGYNINDIQSLFNGKYTGVCYDDESKDVVASTVKDIITNFSSRTIVYKIRHKDGHAIWVSENMKAVKDSRGIVHIFAVLTDITFEKNNADIDYTTGLLSKRSFCLQAKNYLSSNPQETIGLLMIDLDGFKNVNDTFGHQMGDAMLNKTAEFLRSQFSEKDCLIGRVGGDEFMVLLKHIVSEEELEQLKNAVSQNFIIELPEKIELSPISGSIGYVFAHGTDDFEEIYHKADQAMYLEKGKRKAMCLF